MANVEKTVDAASTLLATLHEYLKLAETVVVQYAPQVWDATLFLVRARATFCLVLAVATAAGIGILFRVGIRGIQKHAKDKWMDRPEWPMATTIVAAIAAGAWAIVFACSGFELLLGVFAPDLAVLYSLATKAGIL